MIINNIEILILILIILGLSNWYIYFQNKSSKNNNYDDNIIDKINNNIDQKLKLLELKNEFIENKLNNINNIDREVYLNNIDQKVHLNNIDQKVHLNNIDQKLHPEDYVSRRDQDVVFNNFAPPERRYYKEINIPTRGYPDNYQLVGLLMRENTEHIYNLYGRQKYPGADQYEYYIQGVLHNNNVKIPLKIKGDKEIEDEIEINIPGTDKNKGLFKVKLYNYNLLKYIP